MRKYNHEKKHKKFKLRMISIATAATMCCVSLPMSEMKYGFGLLSSLMQSVTAHATSTEVRIGSFQKLIDYSNEYTSANANDTLIINFGDSDTSGELTGFTSIGTAAEPFDGKIIIATGMTLNLPTTMFGGITDDVQIVDTSGNATTLVLTRTQVTQDEPLFAGTVTHTRTSGSADWRIHYDRYYNPDTSTSYVNTFAGFIGTMDSDANVKLTTLTYDNHADNGISSISATGDVGLVCRTMNERAVLEVDEIKQTSGKGSNEFKIESTVSGNAGGLVGTMNDSSKLILGSDLVNIQGSNQEIKAKNGYAGGIVGSCNGGTIKFNNTTAYNVAQNVTGSAAAGGAGGVAGYYNTVATDPATAEYNRYLISTEKVSITRSCKVNGAGNCGGLFGEINNDDDMTISGSAAVSPTHSAGSSSSFGGLIGKYTAVALSDSLTVSTTGSNAPARSAGSVSQFGGMIGEVSGASYVKFSGVSISTTGAEATTNFGGLVGRAASGFIELTGTNTIGYGGVSTTKTFGGVVGDFANGVIYLQGVTDLSSTSAVTDATASSGQIAGYREYGLVFAASGWELTRSNSTQKLDDVGSWGEVVRFDNITQASVLTVNNTSGSDHYVTLLPAVTSMESTTDFVKTALNIQLNNGQTTGVLRCSGSTSAQLLGPASVLSLKNDSISIELDGTGITGLTRDNGTDCVTFRGTFNGNSGKIKLATGEAYYGGSKTEGNGKIYRHAYNGLLAMTSGATIQNLNIASDSSITVNALDEMYVGNVVAQASEDLTLSSVKVCNDGKTIPVNYATIDDAGSSVNIGGLIGNLTSAGTVSITGCEYLGEIKGNATDSQIGGLIGLVSDSDTFNITISGTTKVGGKITAAAGNEAGGTIGVIATSSSDSSGRKLNLSGLTVSGLAMNVADTCGGFLGQNWYKVDVEFTNVKVGDGAVLTSSGDTAGLVHTATGYWKVNSNGITLGSSVSGDTMSVTASSAEDFGLIVNKGYADDSAIYLELASSAFLLTKNAVALALDNVTVFDELVAYTGSGNDVLDNGQGIVSIATSGHALLKMGSSGSESTYQHKTAFLDSNVGLRNNPHSRYYYNLDAYRINQSTAAQQLLIWSVKQYAHESIQDYFHFSGTSITGSMDMGGYSYYPVDLKDSLTLNGAVHLYNTEFDTTETSTTDNRLTTESAQHHLMQNGLFRNVSGTLTFDGSLNGNINKIGDYCGALVMGTVSTEASGSPATINVNSLELAGIKIGGAAGPLLINKAGSNATLNITNVSNDATSYKTIGAGAGGTYIATSLLGEIGFADATAVKLSFSSIKLDGRNPAGVTALNNLDSVYNSKGSLFSEATLVYQFAYKNNSGSYGVYNYEYSKDWNDGNSNALRNVTYGAEIDSTAENVDDRNNSKQKMYNKEEGVSDYYTRPDTDPANGNAEYNQFSDNFIRYVFTPYRTNGTNHELRVNIRTTTFDGCGTYNHPYIITTNADIENIAEIINDDFSTDGFNIKVPKAVVNGTGSKTWCASKTDDYLFTSSNSAVTWTASDNGTSITLARDDLRKYLAGAYFKIEPTLTEDITLTNGFDGFSNNVGAAYAFRGVIDGSGKTIINPTTQPLIVNSYGSVIYNLSLEVRPTAATVKNLTQTASNAFTENDTGCEAYGAVIGKIFGGDNVIDDVSVKFTGTIINANTATATNAQLVPIGGYVGVVINGGLIFREMTGLAGDNQAGLKSLNLTGFGTGAGSEKTNPLASDNTKWLYVNPIIGRVLNGYAVTESTSFKPFEDGTRTYPDESKVVFNGSTYSKIAKGESYSGEKGVTMRNGTKNYSIADIQKGASNFTMKEGNATSGAEGSTVTVSNAQQLFIISLITESGLGTSSNCKYDDTHNLLHPYTDYMATHLSDYHYVGSSSLPATEPSSLISNATTDAAKANNDYYTATEDTYIDTSSNDTKIPYLIKTYTPKTTADTYPAFNLAAYEGGNDELYLNMAFSESGDTEYYMPDGFRGLGCQLLNNGFHVWFTGTTTASLRLYNAMYLYGLSGNNRKVSLNMSARFYEDEVENYRTPYGSSVNGDHTADGTTLYVTDAYLKTGFGFFNAIRSDYADNADRKLKDIEFQGSVDYEIISSATGVKAAYDSNTVGAAGRCAVGAFIGAPGVDTIASGSSGDGGGGSMYVENIKLNNVYVHGVRYAGGMIGCTNAGKADGTLKYTFYDCSADNLEVFGGACAGGMIGYIRNMYSNIDANFNGNTYGIISVKCASSWSGEDKSGTTSASGLIGTYGGNHGVSHVNIRNVTVKNATSVTKGEVGYSSYTSKVGDAGGVIGACDRSGRVTMDYVYVENLDINGYKAGGFIGYFTAGQTDTPLKITNSYVQADEGTVCTIKSADSNSACGAGGFVGDLSVGTDKVATVQDCYIENYTVSSTYNAGGLIGRKVSGNANIGLLLNNVSSEKVAIAGNTNGGGLVGILDKGYVYGYNILIKDQSSATATYNGYIVGQNNSGVIKIAGFSRQGTVDRDRMVGNKTATASDRYGSEGYVIFADYQDKASADQNPLFANLDTGAKNVGAAGIGSMTTKTKYTIVALRSEGANNINNIEGYITVLSVKSEILETNTNGAFDSSLGDQTKIIQSEGTRYRYQGGRSDPFRKWTYNSSTNPNALNIYYDGTNIRGNNTANSFGNGASYENTFKLECAGYLGTYYDVSPRTDTDRVELFYITQTVKENIFARSDNTKPFVTTNPKTNITASQFLTGDGVSFTSYYGSAAQEIVSDLANADPHNPNPEKKRYQGTEFDSSNISSIRSQLSSNMKSIKSVVTAETAGTYNGKDFPVLMIDDMSTANELVNNYLKLLTNTNYNFARGYSDGSTYSGYDKAIYNLNISKWKYDPSAGVFVKQSDEPSLKCRANDENNGFYITATGVDNENWQFSLIDVQFYDPANAPSFLGNSLTSSGLIAYHLYVPVVVKKMLHYTVQIRPASTTSYNLDAYPTGFANVVENLGNPITMKVTYTYRETAKDWEDAINGGESVCRNYTKILDVKAWENHIQTDSIAVLVDPNNNADKYYKEDLSDVLTDGEEIDAGTTTYKLNLNSFTGFSVTDFNDLMTITLDNSATTKNLVECASDASDIVCIVRNGKEVVTNPETGETELVDLPLRYKTTSDSENEDTVYYAVNVALKDHQNDGEYVQENYYISIFTKEDEEDVNMYHYQVRSAGTNFGDRSYPSARVGTPETPHIFLGNIYTNTIDISETNRNQLMSSTNLSLSADLTATVGFTQNAINKEITTSVDNEHVKIYQTFMVALNRLNGGTNQRGILVDPAIITPANYKINGETPDNPYELKYNSSASYIELTNDCDIKDALQTAQNHSITITESVTMTYALSSLSMQFPQATAATAVDSERSTVGTYMIGYSNLSSTSTGGAASRASKNTDGSKRLCYYIADDTSVIFSYNAVYNSAFDDDGNGNYGQLGLDGKELDGSGATYVQINSAARYNTYEYNQKTSGNYVRIDVELLKKGENEGTDPYTTKLKISDYLTDFEILDKDDHPFVQTEDNLETQNDEGITVNKGINNTTYTYIVPKAMLDTLSDDEFYIPINFKVYSGNNSTFEGKNSGESPKDMQYSNYKVHVTVGLLATRTSGSALPNSDGQDHIIYTNARIHSEIID